MTVALNGDGGDESFAGYPRYVANLAAARLERLPRPLRRALAAAGVPRARERHDRLLAQPRCAGSADDAAAGRAGPLRRLHDRTSTACDRDRLYTDEYRELVGELGRVGRHARARGASRARTRVIDVMLDVDVADLPARRPAGEDGHRDDGVVAGGALAAARPRADGVRRVAARRATRSAAARRRSLCAARCAAGCPTRSSTRPSAASACRWPTGSAASCASYARDVLLDRRRARARLLPRGLRPRAARPPRAGVAGPLAGHLDAAHVRALAPRVRRRGRAQRRSSAPESRRLPKRRPSSCSSAARMRSAERATS